MPNIDDDIRKAGKRLKALRKTASAHNKANRIFVYKRDGQNVSEDALKSQMRSKGLSTESRAAQLRNMVRTAENKAAAKRQNEAHMRRQEARSGRTSAVIASALPCPSPLRFLPLLLVPPPPAARLCRCFWSLTR